MEVNRIVIGLQGLWLVLMLSNISFGVTKCVNPGGTGGCYSSIQSAINAATTNDTIIVWPGSYQEQVSIGKNITLLAKGVENTIIMPTSGNAVTFVSGSTGAKITGFKIEASAGIGIFSDQKVNVWVENCIIQGCSDNGIWYKWGSLRASNNVFFNNSGAGIYVEYGPHYLFNNIFLNNHAAGIHVSFYNPNCIHQYNCLWGNHPNYTNTSGPDNIVQDPQFVDPVNSDFHLQIGSPCIDAGQIGTSYQDCDGTRNDMGVYGGPSAYCGPGPVVTELELVPATIVKGETFNIQAKGATR